MMCDTCQLVNDPIFIPIEQLEMNKDGQPVEFLNIIKEMKAGKTGSIKVPRARKGKGKVSPSKHYLFQYVTLVMSLVILWYKKFYLAYAVRVENSYESG